jgi:RNA polymerase-binding transcription factor DksA
MLSRLSSACSLCGALPVNVAGYLQWGMEGQSPILCSRGILPCCEYQEMLFLNVVARVFVTHALQFHPLERTTHLVEKRLALQERLHTAAETSERPGMDAAVGRLTFMDAYQQHQIDLHSQRKLSAQLVSVRAALERVKAGTYGICIGCGAEILPERLEYLPDTPHCTSCHA